MIAGTYVLFSGLWILLSDVVVQRIATSQAHLTQLQSVKGGLFVVVSGLLLFGLVYRAQREVAATNRRYRTVARQAELLHRILRHDLRNVCNIIAGNVALLHEGTGDAEAALETIRKQNERLIELSRKSLYIREFLDVEGSAIDAIDLAETVRTQAALARGNHPDATVTVEAPDAVSVSAHYRIEEAIGELVENAIVHNPTAEPDVHVRVTREDGTATVAVLDDGTGLPAVERRVLDKQRESPTEHSAGLGLWLVRLATDYSDGSLTVSDLERGGTEVRLSLPIA